MFYSLQAPFPCKQITCLLIICRWWIEVIKGKLILSRNSAVVWSTITDKSMSGEQHTLHYSSQVKDFVIPRAQMNKPYKHISEPYTLINKTACARPTTARHGKCTLKIKTSHYFLLLLLLLRTRVCSPASNVAFVNEKQDHSIILKGISHCIFTMDFCICLEECLLLAALYVLVTLASDFYFRFTVLRQTTIMKLLLMLLKWFEFFLQTT